MADLRRDFRAAPVPIRLSCPFSNGITLNYYARAMSCSSRVLRVLSVNPFERGIQLFVAAPFFSGMVRCQVASVARSKRQASSYEIDLRFVDTPAMRGGAEDAVDDPDSSRVLAHPILRADITFAASELSVALESSVGIPFAKAFAQVREQNRHLKLLALIAAVLRLTREKGLADGDVILRAMKRTPTGETRSSMPAETTEILSERRAG